jgi:hypothetical protein
MTIVTPNCLLIRNRNDRQLGIAAYAFPEEQHGQSCETNEGCSTDDSSNDSSNVLLLAW